MLLQRINNMEYIMTPSQRMPLADDLFPSLTSGAKLCTVRAGKRDIQPGKMTYYTVKNGHEADVTVTDVRHKKLSELTEQEAYMDGGCTRDQLAEVLKRFYPDITADSIITIVVHGKPDNVRKARPKPAGPKL